MVGVKFSEENLGCTFSDAKFKMQLPAKGFQFDLVNSLGRRDCS